MLYTVHVFLCILHIHVHLRVLVHVRIHEHVHVSDVYVYTPTAGVCDLPINHIDPLCKNEGKCINTGVLEYRCECLPGYEGRYCEIRVNYGQLMYMYMYTCTGVHGQIVQCTFIRTCMYMYMYTCMYMYMYMYLHVHVHCVYCCVHVTVSLLLHEYDVHV